MLSVLISFKFKQALTSSSLLSLSSSLFSNFGRGCYRFQCSFFIQHQKLQMVNQIYQFLLHYLPTARSFLLNIIRVFLPFFFFVKNIFLSPNTAPQVTTQVTTTACILSSHHLPRMFYSALLSPEAISPYKERN